MQRVYIGKDVAKMRFNRDYAAKAFFEMWDRLPASLSRAEARELHADHILEKLKEMREYVEAHAERVRIEHELYSPPDADLWVEVCFKDEAGNELAYINLDWRQGSLRAYFAGSRRRRGG